MSGELEAMVWEAEERLRRAMVENDVAALDELVAPELLFTGHVGQLVTKEDDLAFHRARVLRLTKIEPVEEFIQVHPGFAVVSVLLHLEGRFEGAVIDQRMRYTRVWVVTAEGKVQLVAGHMSEVKV